MKKLIATIFPAFILTLSCSSDKNTTTGNPMIGLALTGSSSASTAAYKFKFPLLNLLLKSSYAFPPPASILDAAGNSVTINSSWINIGQIEFKSTELPNGDEQISSDIDFQGPYIVDLLSLNPGVLSYNTISTSQVQRIKFKLMKTTTLPNNAPSGFLGNSIYFSGQINGHTFQFTTTEETEFQVGGPRSISPTSNSTLLMEIKTADLIRKIDLSSISATTQISDSNKVTATNPCPSIDISAADLYTCFRKGIENASNLGQDSDGNFHLDSNEETVK